MHYKTKAVLRPVGVGVRVEDKRGKIQLTRGNGEGAEEGNGGADVDTPMAGGGKNLARLELRKASPRASFAARGAVQRFS
jgi:hypothetical protein